MTDGNGSAPRPIISVTFLSAESAEADIHIEGVNEVQLYGAAKIIERAGDEHMARRAMQHAMEQAKAQGSGIVRPSPEIVRDIGKGKS